MDNFSTSALYISYNAVTEPITRSQVVPYLEGLSSKGIKFYLLTFEKGISKKEAENVRGDLASHVNGIKWFSLRYHKAPTVPATIFDIIIGFVYSICIILKYRISVVHCRAITASLMGWPAAKLLSKKFIFDTRGIDSEEYVDAGTWKRGGFIHRTVASLENMITRSSDHVIVLTERFLDVLKIKYDDSVKFSVIPCAVDIAKFTPSKGKGSALFAIPGLRDKFVIVYVGSLGTWYMFDEMLEFFKTASGVIDNAHLLILTQTDRLYARRVIEKKGLVEDAFTLDSTTYNMMPGYLSSCHAGIFFIKQVFSKISSSPVKFAEYLASGLPVIISAGIGDTERIVRDNRVGVVVRDFNFDAYRKALDEFIQLLKDPELSARCRRTAEKYLSLEKALETYYGVYKSL